MAKDHRKLVVWQRSMELLAASHAVARALPQLAQREMGSQIRRAAESVPANIAEGHARATRAQFRQFVNIAYASVKELQHHLVSAVAVEYLPGDAVAAASTLADEVGAMLYALQRGLDEPG